jgi:bacteriocin-like protein
MIKNDKDKKVEPKGLNQAADDNTELNEKELDEVAGGKLPGKRKPPTLTLK